MKKKYNEFKNAFLRRPQSQHFLSPQMVEQTTLSDRVDSESAPIDKDMVNTFLRLTRDFRVDMDLFDSTPRDRLNEKVEIGRSVQDMQEQISILKLALEKMTVLNFFVKQILVWTSVYWQKASRC